MPRGCEGEELRFPPVPETLLIVQPFLRLMAGMTNPNSPWHAHVYYDMESWDAAQLVHQQFSDMVVTGACAGLVLVGQMLGGKWPASPAAVRDPVLRVGGAAHHPNSRGHRIDSLIHPLTDDDLADHTTLAQWIGEPLPLDVSVLDPPPDTDGDCPLRQGRILNVLGRQRPTQRACLCGSAPYFVENDGSVTVGELRVRRKACSGKPKVNSYIGSV